MHDLNKTMAKLTWICPVSNGIKSYLTESVANLRKMYAQVADYPEVGIFVGLAADDKWTPCAGMDEVRAEIKRLGRLQVPPPADATAILTIAHYKRWLHMLDRSDVQPLQMDRAPLRNDKDQLSPLGVLADVVDPDGWSNDTGTWRWRGRVRTTGLLPEGMEQTILNYLDRVSACTLINRAQAALDSADWFDVHDRPETMEALADLYKELAELAPDGL